MPHLVFCLIPVDLDLSWLQSSYLHVINRFYSALMIVFNFVWISFLVASFDPTARYKLVLSAHYDSKIFTDFEVICCPSQCHLCCCLSRSHDSVSLRFSFGEICFFFFVKPDLKHRNLPHVYSLVCGRDRLCCPMWDAFGFGNHAQTAFEFTCPWLGYHFAARVLRWRGSFS